MTDIQTNNQDDLFGLLSQYSESNNLGGTLMVLDTLLHMLDMVVKNYTKEDPVSVEEKTLHQDRVKEIVHASKLAIDRIIRHCEHLPTEKTVEKKVLDSMPVGVCVTDVLGKIHYANPMFLEITGHRAGEIGTLNITSLYSDSMERKKSVKIMRAVDSGEIKTFKLPWESKGKKYLIESIERNVEWEGKADCMLAVVIDRTDAHAVEQMLKKVVHGDVTIEHMLKTVSHRAKEKEREEARRLKIEKEKHMIQSFLDSVVNLLGNIIYLEDNDLGKDIYHDRVYKATNIGLFAILTLNALDDDTVTAIFGKKSHPKPADHIRRELIYGIILHDIGKIGTRCGASPGSAARDVHHVDIAANLLKVLKGPYSDTVKVMARYQKKNPQEEQTLDAPREVLAKWFHVFYSHVVKPFAGKEFYPFETIVREHLFKDEDLRIDRESMESYPPKKRLLLGKLFGIFNPATKEEKYREVQANIKGWMERVRLENENAAKRIKMR